MSDPEHLKALLADPSSWNDWRRANSAVRPDLSGCDLSGKEFPDGMNFREVDLSGANLSNAFVPLADFYGANLSHANLVKVDAVSSKFTSCIGTHARFNSALLLEASFLFAKLDQSDFTGASMTNTELSGASLREADFTDAGLQSASFMDADLRGARLVRADLNLATLLRADLRGATIMECQVHGASTWRVTIDDSTVQSDLSINDPADPPLRVDDLEVAQFIYLLLNHRKLRNTIRAVTEKGVLLLGRFADGGLETLRVVAQELRGMGYLPFIFDFDCPDGRDLTETVQVMAWPACHALLSRISVVHQSRMNWPRSCRISRFRWY